MRVEFSLVKWERPVDVSDLGSGTGILIGYRLSNNAVDDHADSDEQSCSSRPLNEFSAGLIFDKAFDVPH